jgi:hypothetical protein
VRVLLGATHRAAPLADVALRGAAEVSLRLQGRFLVVGDDRGRAVVIDVVTGAVPIRARVPI